MSSRKILKDQAACPTAQAEALPLMRNPAAPSVLPDGVTETVIIQTAAAADGVEQVRSHRTPVLLQGHLLCTVVVVEIIGRLTHLHGRRNGRQMGHHQVAPHHHLRLCLRRMGFHLQFHQVCHQDFRLFNLLHRLERLLWGHPWDHIGADSKIKVIMYTFSIELFLHLS